MAALNRLDAEIVRRNLARSRGQAAELIAAGRVKVNGVVATKPATRIDPAQGLTVGPDPSGEPDYASRGAHKLAGALDALGEEAPIVTGRICLDAGASTGGFTDVLLRRGAKRVHAVDVGYGQLAWSLQSDPRVEVHDRTNVRLLAAGQFDPAPSLVVADLSFISLRIVLPALLAVAAPGADLMVMVKPQFEVGKERLGSGGVVRDPALRAEAVRSVADAAVELGAHVLHVARSPLPGPSGNVEFFLHLRAADGVDDADGAAADGTDRDGTSVDGTASTGNPAPAGLTGSALDDAIGRETGS